MPRVSHDPNPRVHRGTHFESSRLSVWKRSKKTVQRWTARRRAPIRRVRTLAAVQLMIEMAGLLERMAEGERVAPEEARSIKERLQAIREDLLRQEQASANAAE